MELLARLGVRLSAFVVVGALPMCAVTTGGTAENVISVFAAVLGLVTLAISIALLRFGRQGKSPQEEQ